jgi:hypothetical protein
MTINCADASTTTCQAAYASRKSAIEADVLQAWTDAANAWYALGESYAIAHAQECYSNLVNSICAVWDCDNCE